MSIYHKKTTPKPKPGTLDQSVSSYNPNYKPSWGKKKRNVTAKTIQDEYDFQYPYRKPKVSRKLRSYANTSETVQKHHMKTHDQMHAAKSNKKRTRKTKPMKGAAIFDYRENRAREKKRVANLPNNNAAVAEKVKKKVTFSRMKSRSRP